MRELLVAAVLLLLGAAADASTLGPLVARDILVALPEGIVAVNPDTGAKTLIAPGDYVDFAIASNNRDIYALTTGSNPGGYGELVGLFGSADSTVVRIDTWDGSVETISSGGFFVEPRGITVNTNGLFVLDVDTDQGPRMERIIQIGAAGTQSILADDLAQPSGPFKLDLESDSNGDLFMAVSGRDPAVLKVDGRTGEPILMFSGDPNANALGLGIGEDEIFLATTGIASDNFYQVDLDTLALDEVRHDLAASDVDVEASGTLILASDYDINALNPCAPGELSYPDQEPGAVHPFRNCLFRYDPESGEVLQRFLDVTRATEIQIVPVPEPSAAAVFLAGLLIVGRFRSPRR